MNLLSLVDPRLDNIYPIRRKCYYSSGWNFLQSKHGQCFGEQGKEPLLSPSVFFSRNGTWLPKIREKKNSAAAGPPLLSPLAASCIVLVLDGCCWLGASGVGPGCQMRPRAPQGYHYKASPDSMTRGVYKHSTYKRNMVLLNRGCTCIVFGIKYDGVIPYYSLRL